ncbi:hypothetical protein MO867_10445 [Microbulbifer sp. OS29]|uniref:Tetratricopeptide repeat-containing protein n=1 Tax=Microbulbifer okhotskensis TaxID=2926617 RepID=A0A9X2ESD8_9GAMM|nr:hypothetical protein [Microbulbifer okhotskensis]MCO1334758.1 hypothetical protein [Microbulbifer okhotskensis]
MKPTTLNSASQVFSVFAVVLLFATSVLADDYISPTEIPFNDVERETLFVALNANSSVEQKKQAYLAQLARLTSSKTTKVEEVEHLESSIAELQLLLPDDPELNAALGSSISFKSSFYINQLAKLSLFSRRGNRIMDRAVKQSPLNLGARLQRGISCANMPAFLRRARYAVEDLELVREKIGRKYGAEFLGFVEFYLAQAYQRNEQTDKAQLLFRQLVASETDWSDKAKQALETL